MYKEIYDNLLEYYRGEYEKFNGVSSFDISIKPFTLDEQIMRYGKHISFWYLKKDQLDLINPPDKKELSQTCNNPHPIGSLCLRYCCSG